MKKFQGGSKIIICTLCIAALLAVWVFSAEKNMPSSTFAVRQVKIGDGIFNLRIANTEDARERGLGGVTGLARDEGMLFIFPENGLYAIWMKDMLIPLDILWLSASGEVIDIRENVSPDSFPKIFTPQMPARFVVELSAGAVQSFHLTIGSRAEFLAK